MKKHVSRPGGLHTDNSPIDQPKNTTRFVLNGVNENDDGESNIISTEESNEACYELTSGYIPLNSLYIGDGNNIIFSVSEDELSSEIGIADQECNYTPLVNADFGFKLDQGVDATYRLRRGCERTIYWVDPKPRIVNIDGLDEYKDEAGNWKIESFNLFKRYSDVPIFYDIQEENGGALPPGAYIFTVQYLDDDLNPTEFITSSPKTVIYNDSTSKDYVDIRGSINSEEDKFNYGLTGKAIRLEMTNLDRDYPFYRIGIIQATSGTGQINKVEYSHEIPTEITSYTYTGQGMVDGTLEEIQANALSIDAAEHIEQLENKLLLHNTKGKQVNYCKLQRYASKIKSDIVFKQVILDKLGDSNPKSSTAAFEGLGYMPGEIESFGVVYVFDDGALSPVYHIPGRNPGYRSMMSENNACADTFYSDNSNCEDYWGVDSEGESLKNKNVRHHRFPLRSEVNKPLVKKTTATYAFKFNQIVLTVKGNYTPSSTSNFNMGGIDIAEVKVEYEVNGNLITHTSIIDKSLPVIETGLVKNLSGDKDSITITNITVNGLSPSESNDGLTYSAEVVISDKVVEENVHATEMFGIKFSNIERPSLEDTGGNKVVGYYIVKNKKDDANRTILDSGVVVPLLDEDYYVAHGHIFPNLDDNSKIKDDAFGLIHPEHKFKDKEYKYTTEFLHEGEFVKTGKSAISSVLTQDVMAGTSYDPEVARRKEKDSDGFSLNILTRDSGVTFRQKKGVFLNEEEIESVEYLDAVSGTNFKDVDDERKEIFNVSCDNKIGLIKGAAKKPFVKDTLPYVVMRRSLSNPYANFRYLPYYKQSKNVNIFPDEDNSPQETTVFAGDTYVTPMRYSTSFYFNIMLRRRKTKSGLFNIIVAVLAAAAAVVVAVVSLGLAAPVSAALVSIAAGLAFSQAAVGLKKEKLGRVYGDLYDNGLDNCVSDKDTKVYFGDEDDSSTRNPEDDEVQWMGETVTNLWFESTVNTSLRVGSLDGSPDFLDAPGVQAEGTDKIERTPQNELDSYFLDKITTLDPDADNGRLYQGFSNAEVYKYNTDYDIENNAKIFHHLGLEYDCCSDCTEEFKHRTHWSETSFQEELVDNYRLFLPNNYRDLHGETGEISNVYKMQNNLFIHTTEGLYHLPQNRQERVTGDIVSFIGTGEFFSVPPRRIVDSDNSTAGTRHKWGAVKTRNGILFMSIDETKIYLFDGQQLHPISDLLSKWFRKNMPFTAEQEYYQANKRKFPLSNSPFAKYGTGFISTYDTDKERFIITKKDYSFSADVLANADFHITEKNGQLILFKNYQATIEDYQNNGFDYQGLENGKMKFTKVYFDTRVEQRTYLESIPNKADIHIFLDESGSFGYRNEPDLKSIEDAADLWVAEFSTNNPEWTGNVYKYVDKSERWLRFPERIGTETYPGQNLADKDIVVISFVNESTPYGNGDGLKAVIPAPEDDYITDFNNFKQMYNLYNSFIGICYPIVFKDGRWADDGRGLLQQTLAAMKGTSYTAAELDAIGYNAALTQEQHQMLRSSLMGTNPYPDDGLENYGWIGKFTRNNIGEIIDAATFANDVNELLEGSQKEVTEEVTVRVPRTVTNYVEGEPQDAAMYANNSWTISYSLKTKQWVSWHSYLPNFYFHVPGKFYSWVQGRNQLWRHNKRGHYLNFYGNSHEHIIEYVSVSNALQTRLWEDISFQTEAQKYFEEYDEFNIVPDVSFNKVLLYNSRQISGLLDIKYKNNDLDNYFDNAISYDENSLLADNNEGDWSINGFRDMRGNNQLPMFKSDLLSRQDNYYIDKIVNQDVIDEDKPWTEMESFRDKYLSIRLIFDNFDNIKLLTKFTLENETPSQR